MTDRTPALEWTELSGDRCWVALCGEFHLRVDRERETFWWSVVGGSSNVVQPDDWYREDSAFAGFVFNEWKRADSLLSAQLAAEDFLRAQLAALRGEGAGEENEGKDS